MSAQRCGPSPGRHGGALDELGDQALACPSTRLLARRGLKWLSGHGCESREAVGAEGQVVLQQWLAHATPPGVRSDDWTW